MSPRAWGWTADGGRAALVLQDVPTRAGVDRPRANASPRARRCPHARGGGPSALRGWESLVKRCPHARGGGPGRPAPGWRPRSMSPRAWGWTAALADLIRKIRTLVLFPGLSRHFRHPASPPHSRHPSSEGAQRERVKRESRARISIHVSII